MSPVIGLNAITASFCWLVTPGPAIGLNATDFPSGEQAGVPDE